MAEHVGQSDVLHVLNGVSEPAVFVDSSDNVTWANMAARTVFAPAAPDVLGRPISDVLAEWGSPVDLVTASMSLTCFADQRLLMLGGVPLALRSQDHGELADDRDALLSLLGRVHAGSSLRDTTAHLCRTFESLDWVDGALILLTLPEHDVVNVTDETPEGLGFEYGSEVPVERLEAVFAATQAGSWTLDMADPFTRELVGNDLVDSILSIGIKGAAYAGIWLDGHLSAVLSIGSFREDGAAFLAARLPSVEDLARLAGLVIHDQVEEFTSAKAAQQRIRRAIEQQDFRTVFQPIVRLLDGHVVAYEALTRFGDGRPPEIWFEEAAQAGLSEELEVACARCSLAAARTLEPEVPLSLNFSPEAIVSGALQSLAVEPDRPLVLEVTEHAVISDYEELRTAVGTLPGVRLSVDDTGAGFASLRHILELNPAFVKLDRGLVHGVASDPARAAMIAGVVHFARQTGTRLVAEGVETSEEEATLVGLGVELGQGFFFGPPA